MTCGRGNKVPNPKSVPNQRQLRSAAPNAPKRKVWGAHALLVSLPEAAGPIEQINEWCERIEKESNVLNRKINAIKRGEAR